MSSRVVEQHIRVFCPTHKIAFMTTESRRIMCENGSHTLAESFPFEDFWEYCCDCQNFWPSPTRLGRTADDHCPVCDRQTARRFLCAHCRVISIESDAPARRKQYHILPPGAVSPACPGCLAPARPAVLAHACKVIAATFTTACPECPFCGEAITPPPAFPLKVADFLKGVKSPRVRVTLDPKAKQLEPSETGEFVLVEAGNGLRLPIVLPAATHFQTEQDFSESCRQYYDCDGPAVGEVVVIFPAVVHMVGGGWELKSMGRLKVVGEDEPPRPEAATGDAGAVEPSAEEETADISAAEDTTDLGPDADAAGPEDKESPTSPDGRAATPPPGEGQESGAPEEGRHCLTCHSPIPTGLDTCPACEGAAARLDESSEAEAVDADKIAEPPPPDEHRETRVKSIIALVLCLLVLVVLVASYRSPSVESRLQEAIDKNNLLAPEGKSAFDLYNMLKKQGASESAMAEYKGKLLPLLTAHTNKLLEDCYLTGISSRPVEEWAEAAKISKWASEMKPDDRPLAARAAFCAGHAAYLSGKRDEALASWLRANDLDAAWAMAANGVGVIYNERNEPGRARAFLREAIRRDAAWAVPYNNLGVSLYLGGDYARAAEHFRDARNRAPRWAAPRYWLGKIALEKGDYVVAERELEAALSDTSTGQHMLDVPAIKDDLARARESRKYK